MTVADVTDWVVRCTGLRIGFGGHALLPAFDLAIAPGELIIVAGRNGSGKTTFVRTLLGLHPALGGTIERKGELRIGYVPQLGAIDAAVPMRVGELVGWGRQRGWSFLRPFGTPGDGAAIASALTDAGAGDLATRRYNELSGGQRQRALLARLAASDAALAVLDEPTAAMDTTSERAAFDRLHAMAHARKLASLIVTHEVPVAARRADRIAFFDPDGDGVTIGPVAQIAALPRFIDLFGKIEGGAHV